MYEYYYFGEERVPLMPALGFIALMGVSSMAREDFETYIAMDARFGSHEEIVYFDEFDAALVPLGAGMYSDRFDTTLLPAGMSHMPVFAVKGRAGEEILMIPNGRILAQFDASLDPETVEIMLELANVTVVESGTFLPNTFMLAVKGRLPGDAITIANRLHPDRMVEFAEPEFITYEHQLVERVKVYEPVGEDMEEAIRDLLAAPELAFEEVPMAPSRWGMM